MDLKPFINWIIHSPTLFAAPGNEIVASHPPFTSVNTHSIEPYQGNPRLGFIYQYLCSQLFSQSDEFKLLAEEIQIQQDNKTVGAIDFIVKNSHAEIEHWEVAIKFYLLHGARWYGPNAKDRLDKKLSHMLNHQLTMSSHPCFIAQYPQWRNIKHKLLIQGRLYINPFLQQQIPTGCAGYPLNTSQINGYWCYQSQFRQVKQPLYILDKQKWAVGEAIHHKPYTGQSERFVHCQAENGDFWFVVPDGWPNE